MSIVGHGKNGTIYIQGSGATAVQVADATDWTIDADYELTPSNALGDTDVKQLRGLRKWKGSFKANMEAGSTLLFDAFQFSVVSPTPRNLYIYPDRATATNYFYGTCWPKFTGDGNLTKVVGATVNFEGDGQLAINGTLG